MGETASRCCDGMESGRRGGRPGSQGPEPSTGHGNPGPAAEPCSCMGIGLGFEDTNFYSVHPCVSSEEADSMQDQAKESSQRRSEKPREQQTASALGGHADLGKVQTLGHVHPS